jgi:hypothetical protein
MYRAPSVASSASVSPSESVTQPTAASPGHAAVRAERDREHDHGDHDGPEDHLDAHDPGAWLTDCAGSSGRL